jgi:hypothetical protein
MLLSIALSFRGWLAISAILGISVWIAVTASNPYASFTEIGKLIHELAVSGLMVGVITIVLYFFGAIISAVGIFSGFFRILVWKPQLFDLRRLTPVSVLGKEWLCGPGIAFARNLDDSTETWTWDIPRGWRISATHPAGKDAVSMYFETKTNIAFVSTQPDATSWDGKFITKIGEYRTYETAKGIEIDIHVTNYKPFWIQSSAIDSLRKAGFGEVK